MIGNEELLEAFRRRWGQDAFARLRSARVLIVGAGGLGSNAAQCLVRAGVGHLRIYDFDLVEGANLDRQFFFCHQVGHPKTEALRKNLLAIGAETEIDAVLERVDAANVERVIGAVDVVLEALDNPEAKTMVVNAAIAAGKAVVAASGIAGLCRGQVPTVRIVGPRFAVIGDEISDVETHGPAIASRVCACAALQADLVLQWITEGCFGRSMV